MLKKILSLLRSQVVLLLLALAILLVAVFLAWPLFNVATTHRKLTLLLLAGGGLVLIAVSAIPQAVEAYRRHRASLGAIGQELDRALLALAEDCPGRPGLYKVERALRLPWVLVLGTPGSGKSTALSHDNFARPYSDSASRSPLCTFWLAEDVVFVHPRARLRDDDSLWKSFLVWLAQHHRVDTVLLHLSAADLVGRRSNELEALGGQLQRRLWEVSQKLRADVPLQLMVAQCDRLDGFVRVFAELPEAERTAPWGLSLAGAGDLQPLGPLVRDGFAGLVGALLARGSEPLRRATSPSDQAATLAFPEEVARLGEALSRLVDAIYPKGLGEERPRLQEVCLASTLQEGQIIPGCRHEFTAEGQLIQLSPDSAAPLIDQGAFFLRQPLLRLQARAALSSRPRLRWHVVALTAAGIACAAVSTTLGWGYSHHRGWLEKTQSAVAALQALPPLGRGSDEQLVLTELEKQEALRELLCRATNQSAEQLDCAAKDLTRAAHERALAYLGCRIGSQLVSPLSTYDSSTQRPNELYSRLRALAIWRKGQSGRVLLQGFNALKATTLLQKRSAARERCPRPMAEDQRWLAEYLAALWGHERAYGEPLRRSLDFFVKLYFQPEQPLVPRLGFDQTRVDQARENLRVVFGSPSGASDAEMLFYLSASELGLFASKPLLSGQVIKEEHRIDQVYTAAGCASFFNPRGQWDRWMSCVRDDEPSDKGQPQRVRSSLSGYYLAAHRSAWIGWLNSLAQSRELKPDDLPAAGDALQSLGLELKQAMLLTGRGVARKRDGKDKDPETCAEASRALGFIPFAAGEAIELDQDAAPLQQSFNQYQEALTKLVGAVKGLAEWRPDPSQNSLKPADDALRALADLGRRREALLAKMNGMLARITQDADATEVGEGMRQPLNMQGLSRLLAGFEEESQEVILAKLRGYLQARWDGLYGEWTTLRPKSSEETASPDLAAAMRTFITDKIGPFLDGLVLPLYFPELASCRLKPPLANGKRQILCQMSCQQLSRARALAGRPGPLPAPAPAPAPPAPATFLDPIVDIPECAGQPQEIWVNTRELGLRYRCEASTGICRGAGAPSGPASITAVYLPSRRSETLASAEQFVPMAAGHLVQPIVRRGERVLTIYRGPGACQIRLFVDPGMTAPRTSGAKAPRAPASPLLTLTLPERLVCQ